MTMSVLWVLLVLGATVYCLFTGQGAGLSAAALEGAKSALTLALSIGGSLCLWSGVGEAMSRSGLSRHVARFLSPVLRRLFPQAYQDELAADYLSANVTANLLGLGNAATPMGIAAVRRMKALSGGERASDEMCRLIVMNTASIQLLPATVAALRAQYGSAVPFDILPAVWITSLCSVAVGLTAAKLFQRFSRS